MWPQVRGAHQRLRDAAGVLAVEDKPLKPLEPLRVPNAHHHDA